MPGMTLSQEALRRGMHTKDETSTGGYPGEDGTSYGSTVKFSDAWAALHGRFVDEPTCKQTGTRHDYIYVEQVGFYAGRQQRHLCFQITHKLYIFRRK